MSTSENFEDYKLDVFDTYSFLLIAPFSALASLVLFIAHLASKELRKQPGDLILMISLFEFVLSVHFLMVAYKTSYISTGVQSNDLYCKVNSFIAVIAQVGEFCYSISFLIHIYFMINSSIQKGFIPKRMYHVITVVVLISAVAITKDTMGIDRYGICSLTVQKLNNGKKDNMIFALIFATLGLLIGVFLAIFVLIYTQKKLPKFGKELAHLTRDFLSYYKTYIKACIIIWTIIFGSFVTQIIGDDERHLVEDQKTWFGTAFVVGRIGNTAKVLMPLIFFFVRIQDPLIRKRIWSPFKRFTKEGLLSACLWKDKGESSMDLNDQTPTINSPTRTERISDELEEDNQNLVNRSVKERPSMDDSLKRSNVTEEQELLEEFHDQDDYENEMWMNLVPIKIKESYTRTFLACIYITYEYWINKNKKKVCTTKQDTQDVCPGRIKGKTLMKHLATNKSIVDCTFAIYAPALFREIIESRFKRVDIKNSLDIFKNEEAIKKAGESGGGASGELFMFSHDGQMILKTAHHEEIKMFENLMLSYKEHIKHNPNTQISRIYGLFDFRFKESDKSIKLILMENLFTVDPELILRKYDLKGSKYARRALKNIGGETYSLDKPIKKVMKDLDFLELDREIEITPDQKTELMRTLENDVQFFTQNGIIDYSVVIAVVSIGKRRSTVLV